MNDSNSSSAKKPTPLDQRIKVQFSTDHLAILDQRCEAVGMQRASYVRAVVLKDLELANPQGTPSAKKAANHASMLNVAELHTLAMQVKKLGTNVNQLAKQANQAMVPITRAEVLYMLNQHQLLMSKAIATVEKMLK